MVLQPDQILYCSADVLSKHRSPDSIHEHAQILPENPLVVLSFLIERESIGPQVVCSRDSHNSERAEGDNYQQVGALACTASRVKDFLLLCAGFRVEDVLSSSLPDFNRSLDLLLFL